MSRTRLDIDTFLYRLSQDERDCLQEWAEREGVPMKLTFALTFGEGRCIVEAYEEPIRADFQDEVILGAVKARPQQVVVRTPPPSGILRLLAEGANV